MTTSTYYAIITTRNDDSPEYERTMESLRNQTVKPDKIITITDGAPKPDFSRIPHMWNQALRRGRYDYMLIMADDIELEPTYAERVMQRMDFAEKIVIASGAFAPYNYTVPIGAGRFVRCSWFESEYPDGFTLRMGYETELLYRAQRKGKHIFCFNDIHMVHLRPLGKHHGFQEFGRSMRTLGWHPLYAIMRCLESRKIPTIGAIGGLKMFLHYVTFRPQKHGYNSLWDKETRDYMRQVTKKDVMGALLHR